MYWIFEETRTTSWKLVGKYNSIEECKEYINGYCSLCTDLKIRHYVYSVKDNEIVLRTHNNKII